MAVTLAALAAVAGCSDDSDTSRSGDGAVTTTTMAGESPLDLPGGHDASITVTYTIEGDGSGTNPAVDALAELEDQLIDAIEPRGIGELDGDEFGDGTVTLYLYGPDLEPLWNKVKPILEKYPPRPAWAELRDGGPEQPATRIDL